MGCLCPKAGKATSVGLATWTRRARSEARSARCVTTKIVENFTLFAAGTHALYIILAGVFWRSLNGCHYNSSDHCGSQAGRSFQRTATEPGPEQPGQSA